MEIKAITILDNEPFLRQVSKSVDVFHDQDLKQELSLLEEYCKTHNVLAMASVQIGIPKRLVYLKNTNLELTRKIQRGEFSLEEEKEYNEAKILINPVIINRKGLTRYWENCASCLDNMGLVERPYKIVVEYETIHGEKKQETFMGFPSTVLSHEMDHLDGILHIDIALEIKNMPLEERKKWRLTHDYEIISKNLDWDLKQELKRK